MRVFFFLVLGFLFSLVASAEPKPACLGDLARGYTLEDLLSLDPAVSPVPKFPALLLPRGIYFRMYFQRAAEFGPKPAEKDFRLQRLTFTWKNLSAVMPDLVGADTYAPFRLGYESPLDLLPPATQYDLVLHWKGVLIENYGEPTYEAIEREFLIWKGSLPTPGSNWLRAEILRAKIPRGVPTARQIAAALNDHVGIEIAPDRGLVTTTIDPEPYKAPVKSWFGSDTSSHFPPAVPIDRAFIERWAKIIDLAPFPSPPRLSFSTRLQTEIDRLGIRVFFDAPIAANLETFRDPIEWLAWLQAEILNPMRVRPNDAVDLSVEDRGGEKFLIVAVPALSRRVERPLAR